MKIKFLTKLILFSIIILAATLRFYGLNWDQGHHLHPDERAIIMTVDGLSFPKTVEAFLSVDSPWNPHFFAYGSLPFYLLFIVSQLLTPVDPHLAEYMLLDVPGRFISTISDLATILILFLLGKKLFNKKVGLIAALFYSISVLPIQLSHFYAVDTLLTLFIVTTLYQLIIFYEKPTIKRAILIGVLFGMSLATKISATVLAVSVGASLAADFLLLFFKQPHKPHHYLPQLPKFIKHLLIFAGIIGLTTLATFLFF